MKTQVRYEFLVLSSDKPVGVSAVGSILLTAVSVFLQYYQRIRPASPSLWRQRLEKMTKVSTVKFRCFSRLLLRPLCRASQGWRCWGPPLLCLKPVFTVEVWLLGTEAAQALESVWPVCLVFKNEEFRLIVQQMKRRWRFLFKAFVRWLRPFKCCSFPRKCRLFIEHLLL